MKNHTRVSKIRSRVAAAAAATTAAVGLVITTAVPAEAAIVHYVSSSWVEPYAGASSSTGRDGVLQASAQLGGTVDWGVRSTGSTKAQVVGFDFTHKARLLRDNVVIVSS